MPSYTFPPDEYLIARYSEITSGPQQRIYERPLWDIIPLPLFGPGTGLWNDNGCLALITGDFYPTSDAGLVAGDLWNNGLTIAVVPTTYPDPGAPPVFFGMITAVGLLELGGANLPLSDPGVDLQLWNNGDMICVSDGMSPSYLMELEDAGGIWLFGDGALIEWG